MRVMVFMKTTGANENRDYTMSENEFAAMMAYNEELTKAGVMLDGEGLHPTSEGARVQYSAGGKSTIVDGPFTESKELVAGYWLWQVKSFEEALEWAKRCPSGDEDFELELRPLFEADDFGEAFTPELREQEERLRAETAKNQRA